MTSLGYKSMGCRNRSMLRACFMSFSGQELANVDAARSADLHAEVYDLRSGAESLCDLLQGYGIAAV